MTSPQYPNRDARQHGLNLYHAEMGAFIVRVLRQKPGLRLEQAIAGSLTELAYMERPLPDY